jgi:hypothetical protein
MWLLLAAPLLAGRTKLLTPEFAWPAGMDVWVSASSVRDRHTWSARWRAHTAKVPEGLRVWSTDDGRVGSPMTYSPMGEPWPPFVVDTNGGIVSVEAPEEDARVLRDAWNRLVAGWDGATFTPGEPVRRTEVRASGMTGWAPAPNEVTTEWKGPVPCAEGERKARCAALSSRLSSDPEATRASLASSFVEYPEIVLTRSTVEESLRIVTDPRTLVPRSYVAETVQHVEGTTPKGPFVGDATTTTTVTWELVR